MTHADFDDADLDDTLDDDEEVEPTPPQFERFEDWVDQWLAAVISRRLTAESLWCPQWWRHPEVAIRLAALHRGWEAARVSDEPLAQSSWWVYHFSPHWRDISATNGPMSKCTGGQHTTTKTLPVVPAPDGWFDPSADPEPAAHNTAA